MFTNQKAISYQYSLERKIENSPRAIEQKKNYCCNSGVCCWIRPCALNKEDLSRLAKYMDLTESQFFLEYCAVDEFGSKTIIMRRKHQSGGEFITADESYSIQSPCVMLTDENKCSIHAIKPEQGKSFKCWENHKDAKLPEWSNDEIKALGWDGNDDDGVWDE